MTHICINHCPEAKDGEQCKHCLVNDGEQYKVGTIVVFVDENMDSDLMTVSRISDDHDGIFLNEDRKFTLSHLVRRASRAEIRAGFRLPPPALLFVPEHLIFKSPDCQHFHGWDLSNE